MSLVGLEESVARCLRGEGCYVHTITASELLERDEELGGLGWEFYSCDLVSEVSRRSGRAVASL